MAVIGHGLRETNAVPAAGIVAQALADERQASLAGSDAAFQEGKHEIAVGKVDAILIEGAISRLGVRLCRGRGSGEAAISGGGKEGARKGVRPEGRGFHFISPRNQLRRIAPRLCAPAKEPL
jgi:hypothetical protein